MYKRSYPTRAPSAAACPCACGLTWSACRACRRSCRRCSYGCGRCWQAAGRPLRRRPSRAPAHTYTTARPEGNEAGAGGGSEREVGGWWAVASSGASAKHGPETRHTLGHVSAAACDGRQDGSDKGRARKPSALVDAPPAVRPAAAAAPQPSPAAAWASCRGRVQAPHTTDRDAAPDPARPDLQQRPVDVLRLQGGEPPRAGGRGVVMVLPGRLLLKEVGPGPVLLLPGGT